MREINFRGRDSNKKWHYGWLVPTDTGDGIAILFGPMCLEEYQEVDPETVGEFTGLCDCKGQEIFEGDVLEVSIFDYAGCDTRYKVSVDWYNGNFWCTALFVKVLKNWERLNPEKAGAWLLSDVLDNDCEAVIVGNVYDNPDLLEATEGLC